jgi:tetratricopeptide (TPR) repeat protein
MLDGTRRTGETLARGGAEELARASWNKLRTILETAYGRLAPRCLAALTREIRCHLETGDIAGSLGLMIRLMEGYSSHGLPLGKDPDHRPENSEAAVALGGQEMAFAKETQSFVVQALAEGMDVGAWLTAPGASSGLFREVFLPDGGGGAGDEGTDGDGVPAPPRGSSVSLSLVEGGDDGDGDGDGNDADDCGGTGEGGAGNRAVPCGPAGVAASWEERDWEGVEAKLRAELMNAEAGGRGSPEAAAAGYRLALALAGERDPSTGYEDPDVPEEELREALGLCRALASVVSGTGSGAGTARPEAGPMSSPEAGPGTGGVPCTLDVMRLEANILLRLEDAGGAERLLRDALKKAGSGQDRTHPTAFAVMGELSEALMAKDELEEAGDLLSVCVDGLSEALGAGHTDAVKARVTLSNLALAAGDPAGAVAQRFMAARYLEDLHGRGHRGTVALRAWGADQMMETGDCHPAARVLSRCAEDAALAAGPRHLRALEMADLSAGAFFLNGELDEAEKTARRTLSARRGPGGPSGLDADMGLADTLGFLGNILMASGDPEGARAAYEDERSVRAACLGPGDPSTVAALDREARAAEAAGDREGALALHREALKLRLERLGDLHPDTEQSRRAVARLTGRR